MLFSGCSSLHRVNPNSKKEKRKDMVVLEDSSLRLSFSKNFLADLKIYLGLMEGFVFV